MLSLVARLFGFLAVVLALAIGAATRDNANAHAQLLASEPIAGAVLAEAPKSVRLRFNEPVSPLLIRWLDPADVPLSIGDPVSRDGTLEIPAPSRLGPGTHLISARVISLDGHAVSVSLAFSIGQPTARAAPGDAVGLPIAALTTGLARAVFVLMLAMIIGGALFERFIDPRPSRPGPSRTARAATALGIGAAAFALIAQGADLMGTTLREAIIAPVIWRAALNSSLGLSLGLGLSALIVALISERLGGWAARVIAVVALALGAASMAVTGHAASAAPPLTVVTVALHGAALIIWIGALPPLVTSVGQSGGEAVRLLHRFSGVGIACVLALVVTGAIQGAIQVETPAALVSMPYGLVLIAKLVLASAMIGLALRHRLQLTPALARGEVGIGARFQRSIRIELLVAVLLVLVTGGFRVTPPPRAELAADRLGVSVHLHQLEAMVDVTVVPGRAGANTARLFLMTGEFGPLDAKGVRITFARPELGLALPPVEAERGEDGLWYIDRLDLPRAGVWHMTARVLVTDFKAVEINGTLEVRR